MKEGRYVVFTKYFLMLLLMAGMFCVYGSNVHAANAWDGKTSEKFAGGSGTKDDPYQIATGAQLSYLAEGVHIDTGEEGRKGQYYELTADIDLGGHNWNPIGDGGYNFYGTFDGKNHTIKNLNITQSKPNEDYNCYGYGLFATNIGVIRNVNVEDAKINLNGISLSYIGCIAGVNEGIIESCMTDGQIKIHGDAVESDSISTGGIGGIVGIQESGTTKKCRNEASINGQDQYNDGYYIGGIVGDNENGDILNCINKGKIVGYKGIGGITGMNDGDINGEDINDGDGDDHKSSIIKCLNLGNITGTRDAGGIAGYNRQNASILNSENIGDIAGSYNAGGISGSSHSYGKMKSAKNEVKYCINVGNVTCEDEGNAIIGRLSQGQVTLRLENSYYLKGSAEKACWFDDSYNKRIHISEVKALTSDELTQQSSYKGFDFANTWKMSTYYPVIRGVDLDESTLKKPKVHSYGSWKHDKTGHWKECTTCGQKTTKKKHSEVLKKTVAATCDKNGYKKYVCSVCNATRKVTIKATGKHKYGAGKVTKVPTSSKTGVMTYTCKNCGKKKTKAIAKLAKVDRFKLAARSKGFKVTWKKQSSINGYQIQYGKGKKVKTITITGSKNTSKVIKKLSKKKKYTVRMRTYRKINHKKYYSAWSKKKTVITKK